MFMFLFADCFAFYSIYPPHACIYVVYVRALMYPIRFKKYLLVLVIACNPFDPDRTRTSIQKEQSHIPNRSFTYSL